MKTLQSDCKNETGLLLPQAAAELDEACICKDCFALSNFRSNKVTYNDIIVCNIENNKTGNLNNYSGTLKQFQIWKQMR